MLRKLYVENYALIDRLEMELGDGLNIITGETGAGKTILLGALGLLLGARADSNTIKDSGRNCVIEGEFEIERYDLEDFFSDHDLDYDPNTVVRRVISPAGKSRCYINDLPVQVTMLKEFGTHLIDIHSQHQNLLLSEEGFRTDIVDGVAGHKELLSDYNKAYEDLRMAERDLLRLREDSKRNSQDEEWLRFQVGQLEEARLAEGEQSELETRQAELAHAQEIRIALEGAVSMLTEDETGILPRLKVVERELSAASGYYPRVVELLERVRTSLVELKDIEAEVSSEAERIESDPGELERISARLDMIYSLQHKHKVDSVEALISLYKNYAARLAAITGSEEDIAEAERRVGRCAERANSLAGRITLDRKEAGKRVSAHVEKVLAELGMPTTSFIVDIKPADNLSKTGADDIRFLFSSNKGMAPAPVEKTASGGEVSRVMLALKSLVAQTSELPTIIFDEIDTGVSGRIADAMGNIIEELARTMQVVNITHLPQVASKGSVHFFVYKETVGGTTFTSIKRLSEAERVAEIAKMISGTVTTDAAVAQAKQLLGLV